MNHLAFVAVSYGVSALVLLAMIAWIFADQQKQKAELRRLEEKGLRRRSATASVPK